MYSKDYINLFEQYKKVQENSMGTGIAPTAPAAPLPIQPDDGTGELAITSTPDSIETTMTMPDDGSGPFNPEGEYQSLVGQIMSKLETASNMTKQEIDNVRVALEKAKFDN